MLKNVYFRLKHINWYNHLQNRSGLTGFSYESHFCLNKYSVIILSRYILIGNINCMNVFLTDVNKNFSVFFSTLLHNNERLFLKFHCLYRDCISKESPVYVKSYSKTYTTGLFAKVCRFFLLFLWPFVSFIY